MLLKTDLPAMHRRRPPRPGLNGGVLVRVVLAVALICLAAAPVLAGAPALRAHAVARADVVTLGDLVEGLPEPVAATAVFRAPAVGETGTIQAARIVEAAARHGVRLAETGVAQVVVSRAGRRVDLAEVEGALRAALELRHGIEARATGILLDGAPPALPAVADDAQLVAEDVTFDPRTRRFSARLALTGAGARPLARIAGQAIELVEVQVLARALARGETVQVSDVATERRPRAAVTGDAVPEAGALAGRVARRALAAGTVLRAGDLAKAKIVTRGEIVTIVYEIPGMVLTMRGRANEAGGQGDVISVTNPQSKRTLQATVSAPGRVTVQPVTTGPVARTAAASE